MQIFKQGAAALEKTVYLIIQILNFKLWVVSDTTEYEKLSMLP